MSDGGPHSDVDPENDAQDLLADFESSPQVAARRDDEDEDDEMSPLETYVTPAQVQTLLADLVEFLKGSAVHVSSMVRDIAQRGLRHHLPSRDRSDEQVFPASCGDLKSANMNIDNFVESCPALADGDMIVLQQSTFDSIQNLLKSHVLVSHESIDALLLAAHRAAIEGTAAEVSATSFEVPSATNTSRRHSHRRGSNAEDGAMKSRDLASASAKASDDVKQAADDLEGSTCRSDKKLPNGRVQTAQPQRNLAIAGAVASAKAKSLFRPCSAATLAPLSCSATSMATTHILQAPSATPSSDTALAPPLADAVVLRHSGSGRVPSPTLISPEDLAAQVFRDVEKVLKDEKGQNRFGGAEYVMEATVESNTTIDRRMKPGTNSRLKDEVMLHHLESTRKEFMLQYFGDTKVRERRQKEIQAEELLRQARHQARTVPVLSSKRPPTASTTADAVKQRQQPEGEDAAQEELARIRSVRSGSASLTHPTSNRWDSACDELEVWNAVRTRPVSAAAVLPVEHMPASNSVVAAKFLRPSSSASINRPSSSHSQQREEEGLSFAEMVTRRRDQLLAEARQRPTSADPEMSSAPRTNSPAAATNPRDVLTSGSTSQPQHSEDVVTLINSTEAGLFQSRASLVKVIPTGRRKVSSGDPPLATTIITAAYLPNTSARDKSTSPISHGKPSSPSASVGTPSISKARRKLISISGKNRSAVLDMSHQSSGETVGEISSGWSPAPSPKAGGSPGRGNRVIVPGASASAASVAAAAAVRVQKQQQPLLSSPAGTANHPPSS